MVNLNNNYSIGSNELDVFRNGVHMYSSLSIGAPIDRYMEFNYHTIELQQVPVITDVFTFVNEDSPPTFKSLITGVTGTSLTVPSYTMGSNRLRIYRNGILMNSSSKGGLVDQYTEFNSTTLNLAQAAVSSDVFVAMEMGVVSDFRYDLDGITGTIVTIPDTYTLGSEKLLVYKNGILMLNSTTLGVASDRYTETTTSSITLESAIVSTDVITVINKA